MLFHSDKISEGTANQLKYDGNLGIFYSVGVSIQVMLRVNEFFCQMLFCSRLTMLVLRGVVGRAL